MRDCLEAAYVVGGYIAGLLAVAAVAVEPRLLPVAALGAAVVLLRSGHPEWEWGRFPLILVRAAGYVVLLALAALAFVLAPEGAVPFSSWFT